MLMVGTHDDWFMGLGTACADSSERPAFTLQAWISSTVNRLKGRDGWVNNSGLWLAITSHLWAEGFPSSQTSAPPETWGFPYPLYSQMQRQRWLELPAATQTIDVTVKTRNLQPLLDQGVRLLLEEAWTKAFQDVKAGVMGIKENMV